MSPGWGLFSNKTEHSNSPHSAQRSIPSTSGQSGAPSALYRHQPLGASTSVGTAQGSSRHPAFYPSSHHSALAMVVRNADGSVNIELGRREGFYAPSVQPELIGQPKYRAHKGRNRFCCNGRLMMANSNGAFFVTLFLIVTTMCSFYVFDAAYVAEHISLSLPIVASILFLLVMSNLFKTSFSDPGILPRATNKEVIEHERMYKCETGNPNASIPRTKMVGVLKECVVLKYCFTCRVFRPPRSSHCSVCDNCVLRFDHHCPWVGNCVGLRNYRNFYMFIVLLTILDLFVGACATAHLVMLSISKGTFISAIHASPGSLFVAVICLISVWSVLGLSGFHTYLLASNQTTNEEVKDAFADLWPSYCGSLYSTGNLFKNCMGTLCAPEIPSLLDRRTKIVPDPVISVSPEAFITAHKLRIPDHLDPNTHATTMSRNGHHPASLRSTSNAQLPEMERGGREEETHDTAQTTSTASGRRHRHESNTSTDSSVSVHSYSSCTVHSVPDDRRESAESRDERSKETR